MSITIGIIGRIAAESDLCDGQTVKTRVLVDELKRKYSDSKLLIADTYNYKKHIATLFCNIERCLRKSDVIFILLSRNGRRFIFPIVNLLNHLYRKPILHDVIGGAFENDLLTNRTLQKYASQFDINWIESKKAVERLQKAGFKNVAYLPNFKRLPHVTISEHRSDSDVSYKFCTFSRVRKEKGITAAAQAILDINRNAGCRKAILDIYGPFENGYEDELQGYIELSEGAVNYRGIVDYDESVLTLKNYDMLLFPTYFSGEGFPGTLIDAFSAGLPVIATDWHYNGEIITDHKTGFLYAVNEPQRLKEIMEYCMLNPDLINQMRQNCLMEVEQYGADTVMEIIAHKIAEVTK